MIGSPFKFHLTVGQFSAKNVEDSLDRFAPDDSPRQQRRLWSCYSSSR